MDELTLVTQAEVLDWPRFPQAVRADFECPVAGAHVDLESVTAAGTSYSWCRHCNRLKRVLYAAPVAHSRTPGVGGLSRPLEAS